MQKKVLVWVFASLFVIVVAVLYLLLQFANEESTLYATLAADEDKAKVKTNKRLTGWVQELAGIKAKEFSLPVNELYIKLNFKKEASANKKNYKLIISDIDRYSLFCVLQILATNKISYTIVKDKEISLIYIKAKNRSILEKLVKKLKEYDIESRIVDG